MTNPATLTKPGDPKHHKLTPEDQRKGAIAGAKKRKEQRDLLYYINLIANSKVNGEKNKEILARDGVPNEEQTKRALIAHNIVMGSAKNDHKSIAEFFDATGSRIIRNINENYNIEMTPLIDLRKPNKDGQNAAIRDDLFGFEEKEGINGDNDSAEQSDGNN